MRSFSIYLRYGMALNVCMIITAICMHTTILPNEALVQENFMNFKATMEKLATDIIESNKIKFFIKIGILHHLVNITKKALTDEIAHNYLIGLYMAVNICKSEEYKDLMVKRLEYSVFITTKIMGGLVAFSNFFTLKDINIKDMALKVPWLKLSAYDDFKKLLNQNIDTLQATAKKIEAANFKDKIASYPLCQTKNRPSAQNLDTAATLIMDLQKKARETNTAYTITILDKILSEAYREQFMLESHIFFGQKDTRIMTPKKDFLNNILQRAYIGNATIGYRYFLNNISLFSRYTSKTPAVASESLNKAVTAYVKNQHELFNSVLDRTTLFFFKSAQTEKATFQKMQDIFARISKDHYKEELISFFIKIIQHEPAALKQLLDKTPEAAHDFLQRNINNSFLPTSYTVLRTLHSVEHALEYFKWTKAFAAPFRWSAYIMEPNWQKQWNQAMEQWVNTTINYLKKEKQPMEEKALP